MEVLATATASADRATLAAGACCCCCSGPRRGLPALRLRDAAAAGAEAGAAPAVVVVETPTPHSAAHSATYGRNRSLSQENCEQERAARRQCIAVRAHGHADA